MSDPAQAHPESLRPTPFTWFVRGCGCLVILAIVAVLLPAFQRANGPGRRFSCANNLKQIGLTLKMYSNEDRAEVFPTLSREPGRLMFESLQVYPEYMPDTAIELCPHDADFSRFGRKPRSDDEFMVPRMGDGVEPTSLIDDWSYFYLGYAVRSDEDMERFATAYHEHLIEGRAMEEDIIVPGDTGNGNTLYRLREGIEKEIMMADGLDVNDPGASARAQSEIPILIERLDNHGVQTKKGILERLGLKRSSPQIIGANILYLDGHVEFIRYPGEWPMTEKTVRILNDLDALQGTQP